MRLEIVCVQDPFWQIQSNLEERNLTNRLIMANPCYGFHKFKGKTLTVCLFHLFFHYMFMCACMRACMYIKYISMCLLFVAVHEEGIPKTCKTIKTGESCCSASVVL